MSENIFTEIYNKILGLFGQAEVKDESKNTAVNRLRLVLMQDRTNLTPEIMHRMRRELIEVLSKYVELDKEALELNFEQEGEQMALMLSIPVIRAREEAEIQETLKKEDDAKKVSEEKEKTEDSDAENAENEEVEAETQEDSEDNDQESVNEEIDEKDETNSTKEDSSSEVTPDDSESEKTQDTGKKDEKPEDKK